MSQNKILRNYVSPIDLFLNKFDQEHPELSASQRLEIAKFQRIYRLRDDANRPDEKNKLPEDF